MSSVFGNVDAAAKATIVILAVPFSAQAAILKSIKPALKTAILVDATVPLAATVGGRPTRMLGVWEGSAAQAARELLPGVPVVSAFHNVSADVLQDLSATPDCDILICGDDAAAKERVAALVKLIPGLRPVDAGALEMSRIVESLTALLIALNRRHKVPPLRHPDHRHDRNRSRPASAKMTVMRYGRALIAAAVLACFGLPAAAQNRRHPYDLAALKAQLLQLKVNPYPPPRERSAQILVASSANGREHHRRRRSTRLQALSTTTAIPCAAGWRSRSAISAPRRSIRCRRSRRPSRGPRTSSGANSVNNPQASPRIRNYGLGTSADSICFALMRLEAIPARRVQDGRYRAATAAEVPADRSIRFRSPCRGGRRRFRCRCNQARAGSRRCRRRAPARDRDAAAESERCSGVAITGTRPTGESISRIMLRASICGWASTSATPFTLP